MYSRPICWCVGYPTCHIGPGCGEVLTHSYSTDHFGVPPPRSETMHDSCFPEVQPLPRSWVGRERRFDASRRGRDNTSRLGPTVTLGDGALAQIGKLPEGRGPYLTIPLHQSS